jgi:7-keto-8-aminopelargonate synthetase-like enzyme
MVASLGKAIGITGGVIASDQLFINQILSNSSFCAGMSQPFAEAMGERQLFIKPTYKIKKNLKYIDAYW